MIAPVGFGLGRSHAPGGATGAAFGAGAGLGSALLVDLWCPVGYVPHQLLGHILPIAILSLAGGLIGGRVLGIIRRR